MKKFFLCAGGKKGTQKNTVKERTARCVFLLYCQFTSFFNEVWQAICYFKPNWFDSHQSFQKKAVDFFYAIWYNQIKIVNIIFEVLYERYKGY